MPVQNMNGWVCTLFGWGSARARVIEAHHLRFWPKAQPQNCRSSAKFRSSDRPRQRTIFICAKVLLRIDFPYPGYENIAPLEVPDTNLLGVFGPRRLDNVDEK